MIGYNKYVVIGGGNGSGNHGDEAMWLAVAQSIRQRDPSAAITTGGTADWVAPLPGVKVLPSIHQSVRRVARVPRSRLHAAAYLALNTGSLERGLARCQALRSGSAVRPGLETDWESAIKGARAVVFAGAGGMTDAYALEAIAGWGMIVALASRHNVPVAYLGHGVGPIIRTDLRTCIARTLDDVSLFTTRDSVSASLIRELNARVDVSPAPDWAIRVEPDAEHRAAAGCIVDRTIGRHPYIAVSLRAYAPATSEADAHLRSLILAAVNRAVDRGCRVLFVPTCIGGPRSRGRHTGDIPHLTKIRDGLTTHQRRHTHVVTDRVPSQVTRAILGGSVGVFANRYHAIVFALAEGVTATGIAVDPYYRAKMSGALEWYEEEHRMIDLRSDAAPDVIDAGIDIDGVSKDARRRRAQELAGLCEAPFRSWHEALV